MGAPIYLEDALAIGGCHKAAKVELVAFEFGIGANRHLAAALKAGVEGALGQDPVTGVFMDQGLNE